MRTATVLLCALAVAGCGADSADLFVVQRSGPDRNADVELEVNDGGTVTCNRGGKARALPGTMLLDARELARDLEREASLSIELPPADNSILRFRVEVSNGTVAFSDTSEGKPGAFDRLIAFTDTVAEDVCGVQRS